MKRIIPILMSLMLIALTTGCFHKHTLVEATCTKPKTCSECGETEGEPLEHNWKEATCTEPKKCTRCGKTTESALGHLTPDLTCTENDICERCGEEIQAPGHIWVKATCTEPALCIKCRMTEGEPLGHSPSDPVKEVKTEPTCTVEGSHDEVVYCSRCNKELSRESHSEPALGHTTSNGTCTRCNEELFEAVSGYGDDVVSDIEIGNNIYRVHFTNDGYRNFIVYCYDNKGNPDLLVNEIGYYDGYVLLADDGPVSFEITSSGSWTMQVENIGTTEEKSFAGTGDYVTEKSSIDSGTYQFTHDGSRNFIVRVITTNGSNLLINEIGSYNGKKIVRVPDGSRAVFEIMADGSWSINKVE